MLARNATWVRCGTDWHVVVDPGRSSDRPIVVIGVMCRARYAGGVDLLAIALVKLVSTDSLNRCVRDRWCLDDRSRPWLRRGTALRTVMPTSYREVNPASF